jgi:hypothetical protein
MTCSWCDKQWDWDWDLDVVVGLDPACSLLVPNSSISLEVYLCTCGGTLAVVTDEPHGCTVLEAIPA